MVMAAHSNRSPSPLSSRPTNSNPRKSDPNSATRTSFSGSSNPFAKPSLLTNSKRFDPITPANSPSDFARRHSTGKEGTSFRSKDREEKENDEKDQILKAPKFQSPSKGSKNFMSPTISAASKFTPSPRKKVLVERNDPVRTSISLSDGKAVFFSTMSSTDVVEEFDPKFETMSYHPTEKTETSLDSNVADSQKEDAVFEANPVSRPSKKVTFSGVSLDSHHATDSVITDSDNSKLESSLMNNVDSPCISPLDADPFLPPYDPKTNYLSPRPRFLHYKPNPRIWNKEKKMEDSFMAEIMSDNFSESEGTEGSQTEDLPKEDFEVIASADMVIGVDEIEDDEQSESSLDATTVAKDDVVEKNERKPRALSKLMCFSMVVMVLIAACVSSLSVTHSPPSLEFVKDWSKLYDQSRVAATARANFDRLAMRVDKLSVSCVSFISKLGNELGKGGEYGGPLQFMNLSDLQKNHWNEEEHLLNNNIVENFEEDELEEEEFLDNEMDTFEEKTDYDDEMMFEDEYDYAQEHVLFTETDTSVEEEAFAEIDSDEHFEKGLVTKEETSPDSIVCGKEKETEAEADSSIIESASDVEVVQTSLSEAKYFASHAMGISSFFAAILAVSAFIYQVKYKRNRGVINVVQADPVLIKPKQDMHVHQDKEFSEKTESSCPSEMMSSSFQTSATSTYSKKRELRGGANEERNMRKYSKRESLASSSSEEYSTGSPSYGSFTTYERIPIKHANADEEIITPVRRSSRIRNHHHQITSP